MGSTGSVDSLVSSTATKIEKHGDSALHVEDSKLPDAKDTLQRDWEEAQRHGPGFVRALSEQMKSDTASVGSTNIKVDLKNDCIEFNPSSWDFSEKRSSVKVNAGAKRDDVFKDTGFKAVDAANRTFYINGPEPPHGAYYNPMRPNGIGELNPGESTDGFIASNGGKIDQRTSKSTTNPDGSTTYAYEGQVGGGMYKQMETLRKSWALDSLKDDVQSGFKAKETIGADGKTLESMEIRYDHPKSFMINARNGVNNRGIECNAVTSVIGNLKADGNYQARITSANGTTMFCDIDKTGHVVSTQTTLLHDSTLHRSTEFILKAKEFNRPNNVNSTILDLRDNRGGR